MKGSEMIVQIGNKRFKTEKKVIEVLSDEGYTELAIQKIIGSIYT